MKKLVKWLVGGVLLVGVLVVLALVFRNPMIKAVAERQIQAETGMSASIGKFHLGLRAPVVSIQDLKINNSPEFGGATFVHIPEIHVEYDRGALFARKLHFTLVRFNLAEVHVVENKEGKTNVKALQDQQKQRDSTAEAKQEKPALEFTGIDTLRLTLGRVSFRSLKNPDAKREIVLDVKDHELKNVKSAKDFSGLVFAVMIKKGVDFLGEGVVAAAEAATGLIKEAGGKAEKTGKKLLDSVTSPFKKKQ